jgi:protocatechuate 3,4-dioxygenase beta subunit
MKYSGFDLSPLSRRAFLAGSALTIGGSLLRADPTCALAPEMEEGPYYLDAAKLRRNLTEGKPGVPLKLRVALVDAKGCAPLPNAAVDIWHCDALGVYSGFTAAGGGDGGPGGPGGPGGGRGRGGPKGGPGSMRGGNRQIDATRFLRGVQVSNHDGLVEFETLYPGWYQGRTIHIHLKVHLGGASAGDTYQGGHVSHTGQLFLPEDITEQIARLEPYANHSVHRTLHSEDGIFRSQGGKDSMAGLERVERRSLSEGLIATVKFAVDPDAVPAPVRGGPGRR